MPDISERARSLANQNDITRLRVLNTELVEALSDVLPYAQACIGLPESLWPADSVILKARALIAKAQE